MAPQDARDVFSPTIHIKVAMETCFLNNKNFLVCFKFLSVFLIQDFYFLLCIGSLDMYMIVFMKFSVSNLV